MGYRRGKDAGAESAEEDCVMAEVDGSKSRPRSIVVRSPLRRSLLSFRDKRAHPVETAVETSSRAPGRR